MHWPRASSSRTKRGKMGAEERISQLELVALSVLLAVWLGVKALVPQNLPYFTEQDPWISKPYVAR